MKSTKAVTFGSMMIGMMSIFLIADRLFLGNLGFLMFIPVCIPLVIYGRFYSLKETGVVYISMVLATVIVSGIPAAIVSVTGYGLVALVLVSLKDKKLSIQFFFTLIADAALSAVMIAFFAEYFGVSLVENFELAQKMLPSTQSSTLWAIVILSILLTVAMEVYIVIRSSDLIYKRMKVEQH